MLSTILSFLGINKWLIIGGSFVVILAALSFTFILHQRDSARLEAEQLRSKYEVALEVNRRNVESFKRLQDDLERSRKAALAALEQQQKDNETLQDIIEDVVNAPTTDDGPVSPVLSGVLERLRTEQQASDPARQFDPDDRRIAPTVRESAEGAGSSYDSEGGGNLYSGALLRVEELLRPPHRN